jgi:hypothetical protein
MIENELRWLLPTRASSPHETLRQLALEERQLLLIDVYFDTQGDLLYRHGGHLRARTELAQISTIPSNVHVAKSRQTRWELKEEQGRHTSRESYWPSYSPILEEADDRLREALQVYGLVEPGPSPYKAFQMIRLANHRSCYPLRGGAEAPVVFIDQITACVGPTRRTGSQEIVDLTFLEVEFNIVDASSPDRVDDLIKRLCPGLLKQPTKGKVYELRQAFGLEVTS